LRLVREDPALEGMGTTVTATYLSNGVAHWVHVGDSRLYVFRQGRLIQVTVDQTMAQLFVEEGRITPDQARTHPYNHLLDQCVGCPMCEPVTGSLPVERGDVLLHTTDGLHDALSTKEFTDILSSVHGAAEEMANALIQAALNAGGSDNMTVVMAAV
jgi:protein phosphatase